MVKIAVTRGLAEIHNLISIMYQNVELPTSLTVSSQCKYLTVKETKVLTYWNQTSVYKRASGTCYYRKVLQQQKF